MQNEALVQQYRELDRDIMLFDNYDRKFDEFLIHTPENESVIMAEYHQLVQRCTDIEAPDAVFEIFKSHFSDYLYGMRRNLEDSFKNPANQLLDGTWRISEVLRLNLKPSSIRLQEFYGILEHERKIWQVIRPYLDQVDPQELSGFASACSSMARDYRYIKEDVAPWMSDLPQEEILKAEQALDLLADDYLSWQKEVRELIPSDLPQSENIPDTERTVKLPEQVYRSILKDELGVELDELISWYQEEIEKTRAEVLSIAAAIDVPEPKPTTVGEANDLLWKYAGPCDSPEEMYQRAALYLKRTRALAHEFVRLPKDESCVCVKVPSELRVSYPWGGYENGDYSHRPIRGQMFLNQFNYRQITDGWIKMNAMHETYPGHHVQYVRSITDTLPQTLKRGAKNVPLAEGTAHRTERAFEWIFGEDPFFPLFVAYRRHHTSVRIKTDLMLFYYGNTVEDAIQVYMDELGFAHDIAKGQVQSQMNTPGYFVCYYYGMKKLCDWEKEFGYSKKDYTEELFSVGGMSLENFHRYLLLSSEDKERFKHDFASLFMNTDEKFDF